MVVTGPESAARLNSNVRLFALLALALVPQLTHAADASSDARAQVAAVAQALSSGDAAEAMTHFAKSFTDYEKLKRYFEGLAAFQVENQLEFTDEEDTDKDVWLTIAWDITLTDLGTDRSRRRTSEIHVKVSSIDSKWRIVEFAPLDIFDPHLH
jgi:hypothetical protein